MSGFVASYAETLSGRGIRDGNPGRVMGYYNAADVPWLRPPRPDFAVCDRWFSSVPGATWPNRLYALSGGAARSRDDLPRNVPPMYNQPSFARHRRPRHSWRWYSFEVGTLRMADARYALGHHDRFAFFSRENLNWKAALEIRIDARAASFLEDAARGTLPSVSWIDRTSATSTRSASSPMTTTRRPTSKTARNSSGGLPRAGHRPAMGLPCSSSSTTSTAASTTRPPPAAPDDDQRMFGRYGVRVPALIVSPWAAPGSVSNTVFDHTSIIKTILRRFAPDALTPPNRRRGLLARAASRPPALPRSARRPGPRPRGTAHPQLTAASSGPGHPDQGLHSARRRQAAGRGDPGRRARPESRPPISRSGSQPPRAS